MSQRFTFTYTKTTLTGQTAASTPVWAWIVVTALSIVAALVVFLFGALAALPIFVIMVFTLMLTKRYQHFSADVVTKNWISSNDQLWRPIKTLLKL